MLTSNDSKIPKCLMAKLQIVLMDVFSAQPLMTQGRSNNRPCDRPSL